jgi:hypothetical protein
MADIAAGAERMIAQITGGGDLRIFAENGTEAYALNKWNAGFLMRGEEGCESMLSIITSTDDKRMPTDEGIEYEIACLTDRIGCLVALLQRK